MRTSPILFVFAASLGACLPSGPSSNDSASGADHGPYACILYSHKQTCRGPDENRKTCKLVDDAYGCQAPDDYYDLEADCVAINYTVEIVGRQCPAGTASGGPAAGGGTGAAGAGAGAGPGAGGTGSGTGSGTDTGTGSSGSSAGGGSGGGPVVAPPSGQVGLATRLASSGKYDNVVAAIFGAKGAECVTETTGSCTTARCTGSSDTGTLVSAGTLTVDGTTPPLTLENGASALYLSYVKGVAKPLFAGGESLTIRASGGVVPAFQVDVVAPNPITVQAPSVNAGAVSVSRTSDLVLAWTGGGAADVEIDLQADNGVTGGESRSAWVSCTFPASAGVGSVPSAQVSTLDFVSSASSRTLRVIPVVTAKTNAHAWEISVGVEGVSQTPSGAPFDPEVKLVP